MKTLCTALLLILLVGVVGCPNQSPPGGPGAKRDKDTPNTPDRSRDTGIGTPDNAFRLDAPATETNIKQGESKTVTVGITRGKNFDQEVKLDFAGAPQGVKITPASSTIKPGEKEVKVTIEAAKDAALGKHTLAATGTPKDGPKTNVELKLEVQKP